MATVLFRWNPQTDFFCRHELEELKKRIPFVKLKWPIKDYQFASDGDAFYLIDETSNGGIVMTGKIKGNPFASTDDYSGEIGYFCLLKIYAIMEFGQFPFISMYTLKENIPSYNWHEGDNGVVLDIEIADQLDKLFNQLYHSELGSEWGDMVEIRSQRVIDYAAIKDIHNFDLWSDICNSQYQKDDTHFCENSLIEIDYYNKKAELELEFYNGYGLNLTCNDIQKINMSCEFTDPELSNFLIYREDDNHLHLVSNGINIVCKTISFNRILE